MRDTYNSQINTLPGQEQSEVAGLDAAKRDAFEDITSGANRRGLFFSGIPISEQGKYTGSTYLPAVANLKNTYAQKRFNLQDALAKITSEQYSKAYDIRQAELDTEAAERAARAAAGAGGGFAPSFGGGGGGGLDLASLLGANKAAGAGGANYSQRKDGGYNFTVNGRPVNALQYAQATGQNIRSLLSRMAASGDAGAKAALGFIGGDAGYDPRKVTNQNLANLYKAITGRNASVYRAPTVAPPKTSRTPISLVSNPLALRR